jgi:hypothetical protein
MAVLWIGTIGIRNSHSDSLGLFRSNLNCRERLMNGSGPGQFRISASLVLLLRL